MIQRVDRLPVPPPQSGFLKLPPLAQDVRIYVNGRYKGMMSDYPMRALLMPVGTHRLELRHKDFANAYHIIKIHSATPTIIKRRLILLPPPAPNPPSLP